MIIKRLKLIALVSGCILLVVLVAMLVRSDKKLKTNTRDTVNIVDQELLSIEAVTGESAENIVIEYNITDKVFIAYLNDKNDIFTESQVDYGSPMVSSIICEKHDDIVQIIVNLKEYCTYSYEIKGNSMYVDFQKIEKFDEKLIVIDPGHGGYDVGAQNGQIYEKDVNLTVAEYVCDILSKNGYIPIMTRNSDVFVSVEDRVDFSNNMNPKLFVSIHCNDNEDSSANGTEILYNVNDSGESNSSLWLSQILLDSITSTVSTRKRNVISGNSIHIVRQSNVPVALIEMGFMSNAEDFELLSTSQGQKRFAQGIAEGIIRAMTEINEMEIKNE